MGQYSVKGGQGMKSVGESRAFRWRGKLGIILLSPLVLGVIFSDPLISRDSGIGLAMHMLGWLFYMTYLFWRIWATLFVGGRKDDVLQTEGPYSVTRNPLYVGSFSLALSLVFFFRSLSLVIMVIIGYIIYNSFVIKAEERFLGRKFGDAFLRYCRETPRFFPSFGRLHTPDTVVVSLKAMRTEAQRLLISALLPVAVEIVTRFRSTPSWPHWFNLP